jgi:hypothetical protein
MMSCCTVLIAVALLISVLRTPSVAFVMQRQQTAPTPAQNVPPASTPPVSQQEIQDDDSYAIYSMLVADEFDPDQNVSEYKQWLISEQTIQWPAPGDESKLDNCFRIPEADRKQYASMIADYKRQNAEPKKLVTKFTLAKMYSLLSENGREAYLAATEPAEGRHRVRKMQSWLEGAPGLISFSAIGYSADRSLALVYVEHECGTDCGGGSPHVLKRVNKAWQEQKVVVCRWVAS